MIETIVFFLRSAVNDLQEVHRQVRIGRFRPCQRLIKSNRHTPIIRIV